LIGKKLFPVVIALSGVGLCFIPVSVNGEGEHVRRVGAELLVLQGDVEKLIRNEVSEQQRIGLRDRILGGLSSLPLLLRSAAQEQRRKKPLAGAAVLRNLLERERLTELARRIGLLSGDYPFRGTGILPANPTIHRISMARRLHKEYCAACHDSPYLETERPAFNLFSQARETGLREFAARMVVGVRGDALTGLDNPLTDEEIASLIAFYRARL
jgi:hypothetical protein